MQCLGSIDNILSKAIRAPSTTLFLLINHTPTKCSIAEFKRSDKQVGEVQGSRPPRFGFRVSGGLVFFAHPLPYNKFSQSSRMGFLFALITQSIDFIVALKREF